MSRTEQRRSSQSTQEERQVAVVDAKAQAAQLQTSLEGRRDQFLALVGGDERLADRFLTVAMSAIVKPGSGLLEADPLSIVNAVRDSFQMGLEPAGPMGEGAIVAYFDSTAGKKIAQFQPMVRGLRKLALATPGVTVVNVGIRHAKDEWEYREGTDPYVRHVPWQDDDDPGDAMGAYAYARLNGETLALYMNLAEIRKRQSVARSQKIWQAWPEEMMKKTVLRRLIAEKLPMTMKLGYAIAVEEADLDHPVVDRQAVGDGRVTVGAPGSRMRARLTAGDDVENGPESPQDPSGDAKLAATATGTGTVISGAPGASEGEAREICGKPGMKEGSICTLAPHADPPHRDSAGNEWG